ncbi:MAG: phosphoenolpyruvate synthase [Prevotella sp.]|nr:phosphoenolpyruvate synthase [Bacteroidaceae bacterium]MBR1505666.1 phosphoenolpyruvate synthase [Prevotella sp.]
MEQKQLSENKGGANALAASLVEETGAAAWLVQELRDTKFVDLMRRRIFNVLLIANPYDAFMLEDDGRVDEKIFDEYAKLGLRYPPRFVQVASRIEAERELLRTSFELVICMPGTENGRRATSNDDVFDIARDIKEKHSQVPIVILTPFSHGITKRMEHEDLSIFEYVFCWLGNTDLLLSIIKLMEDKMNLQHDTEAGVQMILLVEDNIRFYSSILPNLYKFVLQQSLSFATEALNSQLETLRMRGRPKIVLARTYEEAWSLYSQYKNNALGIISDCRFPRNGVKDERAGLDLLAAVRHEDRFLPFIMESSETEMAREAHRYGASFLDKNSKKLNVDLRHLVANYFGFGDFIFRDPVTMKEIIRVRNLKDLQDNIFTLPAESLRYHISHNNVSRWLGSRALFPISEFLKRINWDETPDLDLHRQIIFDAIVKYRKMKNQGVVAVFHRDRFDRYSNFARIGDGSLGGKGRGIAFIDHIIKRHPDLNQQPGAHTMIPKTVVLCTDIFDEFMDHNELYPVALSDVSDEEVLNHFLAARLPDSLKEDLMAFLDVVRQPIAVRSSSLLEDSHYQPFAGIYSTYMLPYTENRQARLQMLVAAIKGVYASVFYRASKDYMVATQNVIDQEKMAVILQEVVGTQYGNRFYPHLSGVARSVNYYPIGDEQAEEGVANLAIGLGKYIVDGGLSLRVSPAHPDKVLQTSEMELALRETQTRFYALDLKNIFTGEEKKEEKGERNAPDSPNGPPKTVVSSHLQTDDSFNLLRLSVREADKDGSLQFLASTYDPQDQIIRDGIYEGGRKVITLCGVLQHGVFPLPQLLSLSLRYGQQEMRRPVEIELAVNLTERTFYLLQIRPMVDAKMQLDEDITLVPDSETVIRSHNAIGHGILSDVSDIVYVKTLDPETGLPSYSAANNPTIADEIEHINRKFLSDTPDSSSVGHGYVLVGPGRWGSSDPWLGVPVKWSAISAARVIVETSLRDYRIEPSQGTHFFQNLTSFGVAYFTVDTTSPSASRNIPGGIYREEWLNQLPAVEETAHVRHVRLPRPLVIKVDGMKKEGIVCLPSK